MLARFYTILILYKVETSGMCHLLPAPMNDWLNAQICMAREFLQMSFGKSDGCIYAHP